MSDLTTGHPAGTVAVDGKAYFGAALAHIAQARKSISLLQYLIDARPKADAEYRVRHLLRALSLAHQRGIDVRVLLHSYSPSGSAAEGNLPAAMFLSARAIPVRFFAHADDESRRVMHAKMLSTDGKSVLIGSQNWSPKSFVANNEYGCFCRSAETAEKCERYFGGLWARAMEVQ